MPLAFPVCTIRTFGEFSGTHLLTCTAKINQASGANTGIKVEKVK